MGTPTFIKTYNGPAYTSRQFKQFLQFFSIKHVTDIPYNPQAQDMIERTHLTQKLQKKKKNLKGEYTGTFLSSLSRADFTRSQYYILSNTITIANTALLFLNFLNLPQGDTLT